jgi:antitoxin ParD1/3/4
MATNVHLTPQLERFARKCVSSGRYNNVSEVVRAGLRLLQEAEDRQRQFLASLRDAEAEADRDGTIPLDRAVREARAAIRAKRK